MTLTLPWPNPKLSPNRRYDRRALIGARRFAKLEGWTLAWESGVKLRRVRLNMRLAFWPPDHRRRDLDNLYSCFKPYQDGIFGALSLDDSLIASVELVRAEVSDGGAVFVEIWEAE